MARRKRDPRAQSLAVARGASWEAHLDRLHERYRRDGTALVLRSPPPLRVVGTAGHGRLATVLTAAGPPDYVGVVRGVPVLLEAKSSAGSRWPLRLLAPHQADRMSAWVRHGGCAAVLLRLGGNVAWVLNWGVGSGLHARHRSVSMAWATRRRRARPGSASLSARDCDAIGVRFDAHGWLHAWPGDDPGGPVVARRVTA